MTPAKFDQAAAAATVFGRITPAQKERLVDALSRQGKRVAMMGDGVNDVPALKKAALGIAMESGSSAARNVADMILLKDSFNALRPAFQEGRRIIGGMTTALYLFLTRVTTTTLIIIIVQGHAGDHAVGERAEDARHGDTETRRSRKGGRAARGRRSRAMRDVPRPRAAQRWRCRQAAPPVTGGWSGMVENKQRGGRPPRCRLRMAYGSRKSHRPLSRSLAAM